MYACVESDTVVVKVNSHHGGGVKSAVLVDNSIGFCHNYGDAYAAMVYGEKQREKVSRE